MRFVVAGWCAFLLTGCSQHASYGLLQDNGRWRAQCDRKENEALRRDCLAAYEKTFEDYRLQRECVLRGCEEPPAIN